MPCVACREVVVGAVCATVHATDDYLRWASSHCARTPATANGDLARPPDPAQPQAQPKPAHRTVTLVVPLVPAHIRMNLQRTSMEILVTCCCMVCTPGCRDPPYFHRPK